MIDLASNHELKVKASQPKPATFPPLQDKTVLPEIGNCARIEVICPQKLALSSGTRLSGPERIKVSMEYMMQQLDQRMKVPELCAQVEMSQSRFYGLFKDVTGQTPVNFLIRGRMSRARELLARTTLRIKEIAVLLSYDDQYYFSRLFKSVHGISPSDYRARGGR